MHRKGKENNNGIESEKVMCVAASDQSRREREKKRIVMSLSPSLITPVFVLIY